MNQKNMINSLELLCEIPFDVIVPGLFIGQTSFQEVTSGEKETILKGIIARLKAGKNH